MQFKSGISPGGFFMVGFRVRVLDKGNHCGNSNNPCEILSMRG